MITVIIKRNEEPKVIQMTESEMVKQLDPILGAEILLEDSWTEGLRKVRTPYVCLVEADCTLSGQYLLSNYGLMKKSQSHATGGKGSGRGMGGGGFTKLAMIASAIGIMNFGNRIYNYRLEKVKENNMVKGWHMQPVRDKLDIRLYSVQVGFVPGAIMRMSSINELIDDMQWDQPDLVKMSTEICFRLWDTGRRIALNPSTTYVTNDNIYEHPPLFNVKVPDKVANIFQREYIGSIPHNA
jgi:hypothetical protein